MEKTSLKALFTDHLASAELDDEWIEEKSVCLYFKYGSKNYYTNIHDVKEIIDFPLCIPFPVDAGSYLGLFNLRGTIIPILDPEEYFIKMRDQHRFKANDLFLNMKLRLIVFEIEGEGFWALPVSEVGKCELLVSEAEASIEYAKINENPHQKFNIKNLIKEIV